MIWISIILITILVVFAYYDIYLFLKQWLWLRKVNQRGNWTNCDAMSNAVFNAGLNMAHTQSIFMPFKKKEALLHEIKADIFRRTKHRKDQQSWVYGWNKAFLYDGVLKNAIDNEREEIHELKQLFDRFYIKEDGSLRFEFHTIHQVPFASAACRLYEYYQEYKYKFFCDYVFNRLIEWKDKNNVLGYYSSVKKETVSTENYVDQLGMTIPFLVLYYETFHVSEALEIAKDNMDFWVKHGTDENGLPHYNICKERIGMNNWGRGIAWYILGLLPLLRYSDTYIEVAKKLSSTLTVLQMSEGFWGQFVGFPSHLDSSSTIPILYLKHQLGELDSSDINRLLRHWVNNQGQIFNCSGETYGGYRYSEIFGTSDFIQGITLSLISDIANEKTITGGGNSKQLLRMWKLYASLPQIVHQNAA